MTIYKKNFLSNVIFRIDYPPILELEKETPAAFQSKIQDEFPILEPVKQSGFMFEAKPETKPKMETLNEIVWKFWSKDKKKFIELDTTFLTISFIEGSYKDYIDFQKLVKKITDIFYEIYPHVITQRFGLRYINEIKINEEDVFKWSKYINDNLIDSLNFFADKNEIRRAMGVVVLKKDNFDLNFSYGIFNSSFPGEIINKEFVLDYDCSTLEPVNKTEIINTLDYCNTKISELFEKSIKEDLRMLLKS